jgi:hypothetical protein
MSIVLSHDINYIIFEYLDINELVNIMLTCKILKYDIENYSVKIKKQIFKYLLNTYKCINCPSVSYNISNNLCDNCVMDTCWKCYTKPGNEFLKTYNTKYNYTILKCIYGCKYRCSECNLFYTKKEHIKKHKKICI